jgi:peptidoglycan/LPS O-acetylase OafA/YrhL
MTTANNPIYQWIYQKQLFYWLYLQNFLWMFSSDWNQNLPAYVAHLWSLAVEEQFYFLWPFIIFFFPIETLKKICIFMVVGSFCLRIYMLYSGVSPKVIYIFTFCRLDSIALGSFLAIAERDPLLWSKLQQNIPRFFKLLIPLLLVLFIYSKGLNFHNPFVQIWGYTPVACFGATVVLATLSDGSFCQKIFSWSPLVSIGKYSYSIYIIHFPLIFMLDYYGIKEWVFFTFPYLGVYQLVFWGITFVLSYFFSWILWHIYEKHFLKLKKYFSYRSDKKT